MFEFHNLSLPKVIGGNMQIARFTIYFLMDPNDDPNPCKM